MRTLRGTLRSRPPSPPPTEQQAAATQRIDKNELQPGDLVFFNTLQRAFSHVGIYVGEGKFIHSPKPGAQVRVESMGVNYWSSRFDGARRVAAAGSANVGNPAAQQAALQPTNWQAPAALPTSAVDAQSVFPFQGSDYFRN